MVIGRHGYGPVGDHRIQIVPRDRPPAEHRIIRALGHQQRLVGMGCGIGAKGSPQRAGTVDPSQLQMRQLGPAQHQMQMAFEEAGQQGAALRIDHQGRGACQRLDFGTAADGKYLAARQRHGFSPRIGVIHGQHAGIGHDQVRQHGATFGQG